MKAIEIRNKYLNFFKKHGHSVIPSAPVVPENDPSVLFTTAGMQPLVPYLLGQKHPSGTRLTDYQKCVRTNDIDEVGDNRHLTYFEMLGNWSLGDYFKDESIAMSYEFLTDKNFISRIILPISFCEMKWYSVPFSVGLIGLVVYCTSGVYPFSMNLCCNQSFPEPAGPTIKYLLFPTIFKIINPF